ncbi:Helicase PriA essential for oriC/DnaA-independent DNA replication [hydrothermal vent metagenome]|uniref:DNA 3'-5' helicase n=1 Tax=hydrothermal vent metagenome TaxID=652676 RepID=A0A3B1BER7_9ZZZZ
MPVETIIQVAVPAPLYCCFDYLPPPKVDPATLQPGMRVRVPFGRGERIGMIVEITSESTLDKGRLKPVVAVLDSSPLFMEGDLELLLWASVYYQHPPGEVIAAAMPARLRKGEAPVSLAAPGWRLTAAGVTANPSRAPRQLQVLQILTKYPTGISQVALYAECGSCRPILHSLLQKGWVEPCRISAQEPTEPKLKPGPKLNPAQQDAVATVSAKINSFGVFLLDGVTGSGKTEVYLALIETTIAAGRQALILVPEIALTPQLMDRFQQRLSTAVALMHSGLSDREREQSWLSAAQGKAAVVLGTRSAVLTPLPRLGLIIVDEEHDLSLKQQEGFRYSARDLAVVRAHRACCPIILGSATPSLESLCNAQAGRYHRLVLSERAGNAKPPKLGLVDIRSVHLDGGLSPVLLQKIEDELAAGNQALLFLNRRGYAPVVICHHCGWLSECHRCDARMTLHQKNHLLWCHHCGFQRRVYQECPDCGGTDLRPLGQGTERLEEVLTKRFPELPIVRIDRDSTRRKGALKKILDEIQHGHYKILLGTQMLAKGHHFPDVTLVGILDVDQGLFGADYRAAERMAQLVEQVAGRAGRADKPGQVLIQTRHPDHPLLQTLVHRGYSTFAQETLEERRTTGLPPFSYQALLRAEATSQKLPILFLEAAAAAVKSLASGGVEIWGPVPAPMERRAGRMRAHLLLQSNNRGVLQHILQSWVPSLSKLKNARQVRWSIDVDPQEML